MGNLLFTIAFITISFSFFFITTSINAVNRAVLYLPLEIFQQNVNILEIDSEEDLYFKSELTSDLDAYFQRTLTRYVISYETNYTFVNKTLSSICFSNCQGVKVNVKANICFDTYYEKTMVYMIGES